MKRSIVVSFSLALVLLAGCGDHTEGVAPAIVAAPTAAPATEATPAAEVAPSAARTSLRIDPASSSVGFTGAKITASHDGTFTRFEGTIDLDRADLTASGVSVSIDVGSMTIEPARLAAHLLTDDFFDTARFPNATFTSTSVAAGATGNVGDVPATHTITGDLTLHGVTSRISFPAAIEVTESGVRARSEFTINRRDFGIVYPGMPDDLIHDDVVIRFDVRATAS